MSVGNQAVQISDHVYWVGAFDPNLREFHGYTTGRGTTYNAFLILSDPIVLIDTVRKSFYDEMMERIRSVVEPEQIELIVSNHAEMDHSGCLPEAIAACRPSAVYASVNGCRDLNKHFAFGDDVLTPLKDGESIPVGTGSLTAVHSPMLHWPDSMVTWYEEDGVLFTQDAFGMHFACEHLWADENDPTVLMFEAGKYFANILLPFSKQILRFASKLAELNLPVNIMAPDHGPLWRDQWGAMVERYGHWATQKPTPKAVVVYDTMWGSTRRMAERIVAGLQSVDGVETQLIAMSESNRSDVATAMLDAGALLIGAPTINGMMFPTLADVLTYLTGLKLQNRIGASFGSYGWSGQSVKQANAYLEGMHFELAHPGVGARYVPDSDELEDCEAMGVQVGQALLDHVTSFQ